MVGCRHIRFWGNREPGTAPNFWLPHINSETGKANRTDFKLGRCIHRLHPNKNPFNNNISEKSEGGRIHGVAWAAQFLAPLLSHEGKKLYGLPILYAYSQGRLEQRP